MLNKEKMRKIKKERIIYLDILRIISCISIIAIHVAAHNYDTTTPSSYEWNVFNIYQSATRWAGPMFMLISGAIFLDNNREISIKKIYTKNILKLIITAIFWATFYEMMDIFVMNIKSARGLKVFITNVISLNKYHLWYLRMMIGLYIITPVLRKITADRKTTEYFLIVQLFFTSIIPSLLLIPGMSKFKDLFSDINLNFGYISYFVLGYYLSIKEFSGKTRKAIYGLGILGFVVTVVGCAVYSNYLNKPYKLYMQYLPTMLLETIGIFVFVKNCKFNITTRTNKMINLLVKNTLGIYLIHVFVKECLEKIGLTSLSFNPMISVPVIVLIIFVISLMISITIKHIPILKKYIV